MEEFSCDTLLKCILAANGEVTTQSVVKQESLSTHFSKCSQFPFEGKSNNKSSEQRKLMCIWNAIIKNNNYNGPMVLTSSYSLLIVD